MIFKNIKLALAVLVVIGLTACASSRVTTGVNFDDKQITHIKKGETTKEQLVTLLGQPFNKSIIDANSEKWVYLYTDVTSKAQSYVFAMKVNTTGIKKQLEVLVEKDTVTNYTYTEAPLGDQLNVNN